MLGKPGLLKIHNLFQSSKSSDVRKLAGRLLCEASVGSEEVQDFICDLFDFTPEEGGRVCLNTTLPPVIKHKLSQDKDFLTSIKSQPTQEDVQHKRYWSFPEYKEVAQSIMIQQQKTRHRYSNSGGNQHLKAPLTSGDIQKSLSPKRSNLNSIRAETLVEYVNFPDPALYMVGFNAYSCSDTVSQTSKTTQQSVKTKGVSSSQVAAILNQRKQGSATRAGVSTSTSSSNQVLEVSKIKTRVQKDQRSENSSQASNKTPLSKLIKTEKSRGATVGPPVGSTLFVKTTESTESQKRTDSESHKSYMRHTSNSEQRARSKTFQAKSSLKEGGKSKPAGVFTQRAVTTSSMVVVGASKTNTQSTGGSSGTSKNQSIKESGNIKNKTQQITSIKKLGQNYLQTGTTATSNNSSKKRNSTQAQLKQKSLSKQSEQSSSPGLSDLPSSSTEQQTSLLKPKAQASQDMKGIIKRLNKPEMLLLNHLQNQIKYYYPSRMNKHIQIDHKSQQNQQKQLQATAPNVLQNGQSKQSFAQTVSSSQMKLSSFMDTFDKQRKQLSQTKPKQNQSPGYDEVVSSSKKKANEQQLKNLNQKKLKQAANTNITTKFINQRAASTSHSLTKRTPQQPSMSQNLKPYQQVNSTTAWRSSSKSKSAIKPKQMKPVTPVKEAPIKQQVTPPSNKWTSRVVQPVHTSKTRNDPLKNMQSKLTSTDPSLLSSNVSTNRDENSSAYLQVLEKYKGKLIKKDKRIQKDDKRTRMKDYQHQAYKQSALKEGDDVLKYSDSVNSDQPVVSATQAFTSYF